MHFCLHVVRVFLKSVDAEGVGEFKPHKDQGSLINKFIKNKNITTYVTQNNPFK